MRWAAVWLIVTAGLFLGWICFLAYLAFTTRHPVVLSRPQFLLSDLDVIAQVTSLDQPVTIEEVLYPQDQKERWQGKSIAIENLPACHKEWHGPGRYLLPLITRADGRSYRVAPLPVSPGYSPPGGARQGPPHIYPDTPQVRGQYLQISKSVSVPAPARK